MQRERLKDLIDRPVEGQAIAKDAKRIMDDVVVLDLTFHRPGIRRKANMALVETTADKRMLGLTKAIVDSNEYDAVIRVASETRNWIDRRSLPSPLKRGTYLVPVVSVADVYAKLDEAEREYSSRVEAFLSVYPGQVELAKAKLLDQFDPSNYASVDQLRSAFWLERRIMDFGVPSEEKIGATIWQRERERAEQTWSAAVDEIQDALRSAFRGLVGHLAERLEPNLDGTKKGFKDATVKNLVEFIDLFKNRNLTGDAELEGLVVQARNVLEGKRPDSLRKSSVIRGEVAGEMVRVMTALDGLLETAARRKITFEEDE